MISVVKLLTAIERNLTAMPDVTYRVHTDSQYGNTLIFINTEYYIDLHWNTATLYKEQSAPLSDIAEYLLDRTCLHVDLFMIEDNEIKKKNEDSIAEQFCEKIRQLMDTTTLDELN